MTIRTTKTFSPEVRERAVRMVLEQATLFALAQYNRPM